MSRGDSADPYYRAIEDEFVRRRGASMLLSPRDWNLIGDWKESGIPLRVVLQGIHNVFDSFERRAPAGRRINSLSYCRQEVLALHQIDRTLHATEAGRPTTGAAETSGVAALVRHMGRLHRQVRESMAAASVARRDLLVGCLARVAAELKTLRRDLKTGVFDPQGLEDRLRCLDEDMLTAARTSLTPDTLTRLEDAVGEALGPAAVRMTPEAVERTRSARLSRSLRETCRLPRLTLFE